MRQKISSFHPGGNWYKLLAYDGFRVLCELARGIWVVFNRFLCLVSDHAVFSSVKFAAFFIVSCNLRLGRWFLLLGPAFFA